MDSIWQINQLKMRRSQTYHEFINLTLFKTVWIVFKFDLIWLSLLSIDLEKHLGICASTFYVWGPNPQRPWVLWSEKIMPCLHIIICWTEFKHKLLFFHWVPTFLFFLPKRDHLIELPLNKPIRFILIQPHPTWKCLLNARELTVYHHLEANDILINDPH